MYYKTLYPPLFTVCGVGLIVILEPGACQDEIPRLEDSEKMQNVNIPAALEEAIVKGHSYPSATSGASYFFASESNRMWTTTSDFLFGTLPRFERTSNMVKSHQNN